MIDWSRGMIPQGGSHVEQVVDWLIDDLMEDLEPDPDLLSPTRGSITVTYGESL